MKSFLFVSLFSISLAASAAPASFNVVAETTNNCGEKVKILAKDGEKYVLAVKGEEETKLTAAGNSPYNKQGPDTMIFEGEGYTFVQPAVTNGNPPKINIASNDKRLKCSMKQK